MSQEVKFVTTLKIQTEKKKNQRCKDTMHCSAHLDIFEVLVLETNVPDGCHAQNFGFITRLHLKNIEIRNKERVEKKKEGTTTSKHQQNEMQGSKNCIYTNYTVLHLHCFSKPQDAFCSVTFQSKCTYQCLHDSDQFKQNASLAH